MFILIRVNFIKGKVRGREMTLKKIGIFSIIILLVIISIFFALKTNLPKNNNLSNKPEQVTLYMYLIGNKPEDADLVNEQLNKWIKEDLNATLIINYISWGDYVQKYPQILASGVDVDLIYTSDWCFYDSEARRGSLHEITMEDIKNYMPLTYQNQPKESFEQAKIDGKIYMIPNNQIEYAGYNVVAIRGDLRKKYNLPPLETIEDLEEYYDAVVNDEDIDILPYAVSVDNDELANLFFWQKYNLFEVSCGLTHSPFAVQYKDGEMNYDIVNIYKMPEYFEFVKLMKSFREKGYWSSTAVSNKVSAQTAFENGTSASLIWNIGSASLSYIDIMGKHPEWEPEIYDITKDSKKTIAKYTNNGISIAKASKNYERSLQLLDKLKNNQNYWNLTWLGIEGKHWESVGSNEYRALPEANAYRYADTSVWGWGNEPLQKISVDSPEEASSFPALWKSSTISPMTEFFRFNDENIKDEILDCSSILSTYSVALELGLFDKEFESIFNTFLVKLQMAGIEKIEYYLKQQYNNFIKNNGERIGFYIREREKYRE